MTQRLTLIVDVDGKRQTVRDLNDIKRAVGAIADDADKSGDALGGIGDGIGGLAFQFNNVLQAAQVFFAQLSQGYDLLIGQNERFRQGILESAATIAANSDIELGGRLITDPTEAIQALQAPIEESIRRVEEATRSLVGVTEQETAAIFNTILSNSALLAEQSQEFPDSIRAAESLAPGLTAALGTLQVPLAQASQEIRALLQGDIDPNAALANALQISRQDIERARGAGELVDFLNQRFETFTAANALAAQSVSGITSNIQGLIEVASRAAGEPLFELIVEQLSRLEQFLTANEKTIQAFGIALGEIAADAIAPIGDALVDDLIPALFEFFEAVSGEAGDVDELFELLGEASANGIRFLADAIELLSDNADILRLAIRAVTISMEALNSIALVGLLENIQGLSDSFEEMPPIAQRVVQALSPLISGLDLTRDAVTQLVDLGFDLVDEQGLSDSQQRLGNLAGAADEAADSLNELGQIEIGLPALNDLGTQSEQIAQQLDQALSRATAGEGAFQEVSEAAKQAVELTNQALEQGVISPAEAIANLQSIVEEETLSFEQRVSAQRALTQAQESENNRRLQSNRTAQQEVQRLVAQGEIRDIEGQRRITELRAQELAQRLQDTRDFLAQEQAAGRGDGERAQQLIQQEQELQTQLIEERANAERLARQAATEEIEREIRRANRLIEDAEVERSLNTQRLLNDGVISQREADALRTDSTRERLQAELELEQERLEQLRALPLPNDPEDRSAAEREIRESVQRTSDLQLSLLENERQAQEQLAQQVQQALQDESALIQRQSNEIQRQVDLIGRKAQISRTSLESESAALQRQNQLISAQSALINAQNALSSTEGQIRVDQLNEAAQLQQRLTQTEDRGVRRIIEQRLRQLGIRGDEEAIARQIAQQEIDLARQQLAAFNQQSETRRQQLEIELQLEEIAQRRLRLEAQLQAAQAQGQLAQAQSQVLQSQNELAQAEAIVDPEDRARAVAAAQEGVVAAEASLGASQQSVRLSQEAVAQLDEQERAQAAIADLSRRTLEIELEREQAQVRANAESAIFAANLRQAELSATNINEALSSTRGSQVQGFKDGGVAPKGLAMVGEAGPELIRLGSTSRVFSNPETQQIAQKALATTGITSSTVGTLSSGGSNGDVIRAIRSLEKTMQALPNGVTINGLNMPQSFSLPQDQRLAAKEAARVMRQWERDLTRMGS